MNDMEDHLIFEYIPLDPSKLTGQLQVRTTDGLDLSKYFHVISINNIQAGYDKLTEVTLTIYASVGLAPKPAQE